MGLNSEDFLNKPSANVGEAEDECKNFKEMLTFQCPDCPKCFEKKNSLSAHFKVHKKRELLKINKCKKIEPGLHEVEEVISDSGQREGNDVMEKIPRVIVKEEIDITPQIIEEPMGDFDDKAEWFNNKYEDSEYVTLYYALFYLLNINENV